MTRSVDLAALVAQQLAGHGARRWVVGYSGGLDSSVLLWLCKHYCERNGQQELLAVHVNHQLSPHAASWQEHCQRQCAKWGLPLETLSVSVDHRNGGVEQAARQARYAAFARICRPGDALLLAHHANDQAETFLLRALRGSGTTGLSAMQCSATWQGHALLRPLLEVTREQLVQYANEQNLTWVDDESNTNERWQRNFLRHRVVPLLKEHWPAAVSTLARSARLVAEEQRVLMRLIAAQADPHMDHSQRNLDLAHWISLPADEQRLWLRYWLSGIDPLLPSDAVLTELMRQAGGAKRDSQVRVRWGARDIRRFRGRLWCVDHLPDPPSHWSCPVSTQPCQTLPGGFGQVVWQPRQPGNDSGLRVGQRQSGWVWRLRQGGENFRPARRPSRPLKKWLQESPLPPWLRDRVPLLYAGDRLIGVPGIGVVDDLAATPGEPAEWMVWVPLQGELAATS